ncbi:MAG TPA: carboxypeptidase regulatory-like domain-containing protein [Candidatus Sulfotelmatobacter sp.]|nr:carboxypeptidase regulatory-like domain-containing protein [Candidatus Sulfotelmatobacter sp.]
MTPHPASIPFSLSLTCRFLIAAALACLSLSNFALCQTSTGRVVGFVTDSSGAAMIGAKVTVVNTGTNVQSITTTDATGAYQVLDLPIGNYSVTVEITGFRKAVIEAQRLDINQSLRIDIHMKVGATTETIDVQSQAAQVETLNPTIGATVSGAPVESLPLNGRDVLDLALTQPGVAPAPDSGYGGGSFTIAGGRADAVSYVLDGGTNNSVTGNSVVFDPNPDTIAEFRILSNNYTAEYGRNGGGTISVVTKSGTNDFHGSLFDYLRNDAFNANDFFDNLTGNPKEVLKRNQFGGTVGGPIVKDKIFFFFGYQGQRQSAVVHGIGVATYTPAELGGDFSHHGINGFDPNGVDPGVACYLSGLHENAVDGNGGPIPDGSSCGVAPHSYFQSNPALATQGIIDPTTIDPVAKAYIAAGLVPTSTSGQLNPLGSATDNREEYTGRADFYLNQSDRLSLTVGSSQVTQVQPFDPGGGDASVPGFPSNIPITNQFLNIGYTKSISQSVLNEFHATAERYYNHDTPGKTLPGPTALGVTINSDLESGPPIINLFDSGLNLGFNENVPRKKADNTYAFSDNLTWIKGKHSVKAGGRLAFLQENSVYSYATNGWFLFYGSATGVGSGSDLADFLFGAPDEYLQFPSGNNNEHQKQWSAFVQDEWKVTPRLTITAGLRYEYTGPETDIHGHTFALIPGLQSTRFQNAPPGLVVPGDSGAPKGWYFPDYKDLAPRFGFAWDPFGNGKTSVRGGAGMFFDTLNGWMSDWNNGVLPWWPSADLFFGATPTDAQSTNMTFPYETAGVPDPFPSVPPPPNMDFSGFYPYGFGDLFVNPHLKTPYIYQYNLSVQRQLANGLMLELGYVGSSSHKLLTWLDENPIVPGQMDSQGNPARLVNIKQGLIGPMNGYAPLTTFDGLNNANYNGFLASVTKQSGNVAHLGSMFFTASYTWSHNLDNGSGFNQRSQQISYFRPHAFYGNSDFDMRQRFVLSGGWELPFAEYWATGPKRLTKGWSLFPIFIIQSGTPIDLYGGYGNASEIDPGPSGFGDPQVVRADQLIPSVQKLDPRHIVFDSGGNPQSFYFNPNDFGQNPCAFDGTCPVGYYGTYRRNSLTGPGRVNLDLSLEKATPITEKIKLAFRVEAFNIFNHTQFKNPGSTRVSSPLLGQITTTYDPRILQLALKLTF